VLDKRYGGGDVGSSDLDPGRNCQGSEGYWREGDFNDRRTAGALPNEWGGGKHRMGDKLPSEARRKWQGCRDFLGTFNGVEWVVGK